MKIKKDMYVRFENGVIDKIKNVKKNGDYYHMAFYSYKSLEKNDICNIKDIEENILNLFEEDDIILSKDGDIYQVYMVDDGYVFTKSFDDDGMVITLTDYQIDKILTKEQFENNCYKIGG